VNWTYLTVCVSSHAAIKERWGALLSTEPAWGLIDTPEHLADAMDRVLHGFWTVLRTGDVEGRCGRIPPLDLPPWSTGACRLDSTLAFLAAGKRSVQMVVQKAGATQRDLPREERAVQWSELMLAFDVVSQREIERVCSSCLRRQQCVIGDCSHPFAEAWGSPRDGSARA
jgi:hypothetical protein